MNPLVKHTTDYIIRSLRLTDNSVWYLLSLRTNDYMHLGSDNVVHQTNRLIAHNVLLHSSVEEAELAYCTWLLSHQ